jgi:hypothetical protein
VARHTDPRSLLRAQGQRFNRVLGQLVIEHEKMTKEMRSEAIGLTSGTVRTSTLRKLSHPFGRRASGRKRGRLPVLPINAQSGRLRAGFVRVKVPGGSGKIHYDLTNKAPYAKYVLSLGGTTKMVSRGFWREMRKVWRKKNFELLLRMRGLK